MLDFDILIPFLLCVLEQRAAFNCQETMAPPRLWSTTVTCSVGASGVSFNNWVGGSWVVWQKEGVCVPLLCLGSYLLLGKQLATVRGSCRERWSRWWCDCSRACPHKCSQLHNPEQELFLNYVILSAVQSGYMSHNQVGGRLSPLGSLWSVLWVLASSARGLKRNCWHLAPGLWWSRDGGEEGVAVMTPIGA